jgi:hypothetical protein
MKSQAQIEHPDQNPRRDVKVAPDEVADSPQQAERKVIS